MITSLYFPQNHVLFHRFLTFSPLNDSLDQNRCDRKPSRLADQRPASLCSTTQQCRVTLRTETATNCKTDSRFLRPTAEATCHFDRGVTSLDSNKPFTQKELRKENLCCNHWRAVCVICSQYKSDVSTHYLRSGIDGSFRKSNRN